MTKQEKLLETFLKNPTSLKAKDIIKILEQNRFLLLGVIGSHHTYKNGKYKITLPIHHNDCKEIYKKKALKLFKQMQEESKAE